MPYKNAEDKKEAIKRWRLNNPDRQKEIEKRSRERNSTKIKESRIKFHEQHPKKAQEYRERFVEKHPDHYANTYKRSLELHPNINQERWLERKDDPVYKKRVLLATKKYRITHKEAVAEKNKLWKQSHPDKVRAMGVRRYAKNPTRSKDAIKRFVDRNPGVRTLYSEKRRAKKLGAFMNDFSRHEWTTMKAAYNHSCAYCGKKAQRLTQDHIIPLTKNGSHTAANIVPACQSCNSTKRDFMWWDVFEPRILGA